MKDQGKSTRLELKNREQDYLFNGQTYYNAIRKEEPAGKPLAKCQTKRIKLTLLAPEDLEIERKNSLEFLKYVTISRLCWEAYQQGCLLTQEDLARLMRISVSGVKTIMRKYRREGVTLPTRGNFYDIGPRLSVKYYAVKMYLSGLPIIEISWRIHQSVYVVEQYIKDYEQVYQGFETGQSFVSLAKAIRQSEALVKQYIELHKETKQR
ncbi:MAG: DUF1670 domain-containing protein [Clostridia bacterium]|nr:DUF1670 domain-containing protein [Clostridia bacterium]